VSDFRAGTLRRDGIARRLAEIALTFRRKVIMRGPVGFNPGRRLAERRLPRLRYPVVEAA